VILMALVIAHDLRPVPLHRTEGAVLMVENRPWLPFSPMRPDRGVAFLCFPVWMALVASTHTGEALSAAPIPMWFGDQGLENYTHADDRGGRRGGRRAGRRMMWNS
jgi:sn-glycerol 3-phosphate transport system permease protein